MRPVRSNAGTRCLGVRLLVVAVACGSPNIVGAGLDASVAGHEASAQPARHAPVVAAASDLKFALEEVSAEFTRQTGERVELVFGASGNLTRQLLDGAPYELFLSADEGFVFKLADAGVARDRGVLYGIGRLVIFAPRGSALSVDEHLNGLRDLLEHGGVTRFAIANPEHAPYGRAAEAALRARGLWDSLQPHLVLGENIAQAAQFAMTGNAVGGLLSHSLVLAAPLRDKGTYAVLPDTLHPPLRQRMALTKKAGAVAKRFYDFIQEPSARSVLAKYGFQTRAQGVGSAPQ